MAHFIGYLKGNRGEASRLGTGNSGIRAQAQGWDIGGKVYCSVNNNGEDIVEMYVTRGSNGYGSGFYLGTFKIKDGKIIKIGEEE